MKISDVGAQNIPADAVRKPGPQPKVASDPASLNSLRDRLERESQERFSDNVQRR